MSHLQRPSGALGHGLFSTCTVLPGESVEEFDAMHAQLVADYEPQGPIEIDIVESLAGVLWRKRRLQGLTRAPRPEPEMREMIMDPKHPRYVPGKWTHAIVRKNMPDRPPLPAYVPGDWARARPAVDPSSDVLAASDQAEQASAASSVAPIEEGLLPTLEAVVEGFETVEKFDALIGRHIARLGRAKGLRHAVKVSGQKTIDVTPERAPRAA